MTTPMSQIEKYMQQQLKRQERAIVNTLAYVGEQCVNKARENGSYTDQTGNLRSSIGYVIAVDGRVRHASNFEPVQFTDKDGVTHKGDEGGKTGKDYAKELVAKHPKGAVLIVVAGMHYAKYVAATGRDVLASAELEAQQLIPKLLKQLETDIDYANGQTGTN